MLQRIGEREKGESQCDNENSNSTSINGSHLPIGKELIHFLSTTENSTMKFHTILPICFLLLACLTTAQAADIYVSQEGADTNDGTASQPLATLAAAQTKARRYTGKESVTVWVADGTYHLSQTLHFDGADSGTADAPIIYRATAGAKVTLKGSLSRWTQ